MASQLYFPETAFIFPGRKDSWSIRWFTPKSEVELCGHATMAAAHVLYEEGLVTKDSEITFSSNSGELRVGNDQKHRLRMDFPLLKARSSHISPALVEGLGAYPDEVYLGTNCMCVFGEEETVALLEPDFKILSGLESCLGVIATARTSRIGYHFVSRTLPQVSESMRITQPVRPLLALLIGERSLGRKSSLLIRHHPEALKSDASSRMTSHSSGWQRLCPGQDEVLKTLSKKMEEALERPIWGRDSGFENSFIRSSGFS